MKLMFLYSPEATRGDHLAPCDLRIDHGFAAAPPIVDHNNKILHGINYFLSDRDC
jgi:hypothetical protein